MAFLSKLLGRTDKRPSEQETLKLITVVFARAFALEFVLKMCVSRQLIEMARDQTDQNEINAIAAALRSSVLELASKEVARLPDKTFASIADPIVRDVVSNIYDVAARQIDVSAKLHFGSMPSTSKN